MKGIIPAVMTASSIALKKKEDFVTTFLELFYFDHLNNSTPKDLKLIKEKT
jgi:hypothetical protein